MNSAPQLYTTGFSVPTVGVGQAERAEADGWDGILLTDSQNLSGDVYAILALAARATERVMLGTGVTNPYTRHPAVTASAIATIQAESKGRAVLGIGRGDSSLAHLGLGPAPVAAFEGYLRRVQGYLRSEDVPFEDARGGPFASGPSASRLHWLRPDQPKVPVDVAATGPRVMAVGARHAERVSLAVGADPERVRWGIEQVTAVNPHVSVGAFVNVVVHPDPAAALDLSRGAVVSFARFSAMHGTPTGPLTAEQRDVLERIPQVYDMERHFRSSGRQAELLTPEFADRFAVLGPADYCVARLRELVDLGLDRLVVIGPAMDSDREGAAAAHRRFVDEVMPALRDG